MTAAVVNENCVNLDHYDIQVVPGDGDCLYRCIIEATKLIDKDPGRTFHGRRKPNIHGFRRAVADAFTKDNTLFPEINEDGTVAYGKEGRRLKSQLVKSIRDGDWGNSTIAAKIQEMYDVPITIVNERSSLVVNARPISADGVILLWRSNNIHYDWLRLKERVVVAGGTDAHKTRLVPFDARQFKF
mgnify:CR=1 FL=1